MKKVIPNYLIPLVDSSHFEDGESIKLSQNGESKFEVFYTGTLELVDNVTYINSNPEKATDDVVRIFLKTNEDEKQYVVFDGLIHGYDNLFCDEHEVKERPLKQLEFGGDKLFSVEVTLGYGIDFDAEKEDYVFDAVDSDMQKVYNRTESVSWEQIKQEGYDWITIQFTSEKGASVFVDLELA